MHSSPHPNQVRSACERCRRQKLRCSRPVGASASCARCTRLGLACQPGLQRRVGRPPKKDIVLRKPSEAVVGSDAAGAAAEDVQFLFGSPVPGVDWDLGSFCFNSPDSLPFPMEDWPAVRELDPLQSEQQQQVIILPDSVHFQTLSRLNVEIHKGWEYMTRVAAKARFNEFICEGYDTLNGYRNVQNVIKSSQEFLVVIKALHRQLGTRPVSRQNPPPTSSTDLVTLVLDPVLSESSSSSTPPSVGSPPSSTSASSSAPPVFDSPTMFLVISCYVQLVKHLEFVVKIIYDSISDTTHDVLDPAPMEFAEVAVIEAPSQFILFSELIRHVMGQTNLVLGLPSPWSGRSAWTGLLTCQRYRDMVNVELGAVEGMWTARPGRLMEMTRLTKEVFVELSMMGLDA
ncbi:hypothetical protein ACJZ2D_012909 [Fusarium nematophilum]